MKIRPFWVLLHRYTGLAMAVTGVLIWLKKRRRARVDLAGERKQSLT